MSAGPDYAFSQRRDKKHYQTTGENRKIKPRPAGTNAGSHVPGSKKLGHQRIGKIYRNHKKAEHCEVQNSARQGRGNVLCGIQSQELPVDKLHYRMAGAENNQRISHPQYLPVTARLGKVFAFEKIHKSVISCRSNDRRSRQLNLNFKIRNS